MANWVSPSGLALGGFLLSISYQKVILVMFLLCCAVNRRQRKTLITGIAVPTGLIKKKRE